MYTYYTRLSFLLLRLLPVILLGSGTYISTNSSLLARITTEIQNSQRKEEKLLPLLTPCLEYGNQTNKPTLYACGIFKLFSNMIKKAQYIPATSMETMLDKLTTQLAPYIKRGISHSYLKRSNIGDEHLFDRFHATVNTMLYMKFSNEYENFQREPEQFLDQLSTSIMEIAQEEVHIEKLRNAILRFLELTLAKLVWSVNEPEKSWQSVKNISHKLALLFENSILDDVNDLDDLFWSLIIRYGFFLDLTASLLDPHFYEQIKHDINQEKLLLLELAEQDTFLETKNHYLQRTIMQAQAKNHAYQKGVLAGR